jgi:hypothetical protein
MAGENELFPGNIPQNISHFIGMEFVGIGDVRGRDRMEKKYNGRRFIQLFRKQGLLAGANLLDSSTESGVIKNALIKGLRQHGPVSSGFLPIIQNLFIKNILWEVERT